MSHTAKGVAFRAIVDHLNRYPLSKENTPAAECLGYIRREVAMAQLASGDEITQFAGERPPTDHERRLAACLAALAGFSTESIEAGIVNQMKVAILAGGDYTIGLTADSLREALKKSPQSHSPSPNSSTSSST